MAHGERASILSTQLRKGEPKPKPWIGKSMAELVRLVEADELYGRETPDQTRRREAGEAFVSSRKYGMRLDRRAYREVIVVRRAKGCREITGTISVVAKQRNR